MEIAPDIIAQTKADFPAEKLDEALAQLAASAKSDRIQRCIIFAARGHPWKFRFLCKLAKDDFRDVIHDAEYYHDARLYDFNKPIPEASIDEPYGTISAPGCSVKH